MNYLGQIVQIRQGQLSDAAEFGRIGKYYAVEDMLTTDPSQKFGGITLREHYTKVSVEGQEYDPYTTIFGKTAAAAKVAAVTSSESTD